MMSAKSYIEHAREQREFVSSHRYTPYFWGNSTCDEIIKNMNLSLLNLCKAVLCYSGIDFNGKTEEEIVNYVYSNGIFHSDISSILGHKQLWEHAARRRDRNSRNYQLALTANYLEHLENIIIREYNL